MDTELLHKKMDMTLLKCDDILLRLESLELCLKEKEMSRKQHKGVDISNNLFHKRG